jgi:hypothetical protein
MASPMWGGAYSSLFLGPFRMAHFLVMTRRNLLCAAGCKSERAELTPLLFVPYLTHSQWKICLPELIGSLRCRYLLITRDVSEPIMH